MAIPFLNGMVIVSIRILGCNYLDPSRKPKVPYRASNPMIINELSLSFSFRIYGSKSSHLFRMHPTGVLALVGELPIYRKRRKRHPLSQFSHSWPGEASCPDPDSWTGEEASSPGPAFCLATPLAAKSFVSLVRCWEQSLLSRMTLPPRTDLVFPDFSYRSVFCLQDFGGIDYDQARLPWFRRMH